MQNSQQHNWIDFSIEQIIGGKAADGVLYLELFLKDYQDAFSTKVNPGCKKCLNTYLQNYKSKFGIMSNSKYKLKKKYEGIPLGFGTGVFVTNQNITDEIGAKLFKSHANPTQIFEVYPVEQIEVEAEIVKADKPKKPRKKRSTTKK